MTFFKTKIKFILLLIMLIFTSHSMGMAQDDENIFETDYSVRSIDKDYSPDDYMKLKAAQKTVKEGYEYFSIVKSNEYDRRSKNASRSTFDRTRNSRSQKPRMHIDLTIRGHENDDGENIYNAKEVIAEMKSKYAD